MKVLLVRVILMILAIVIISLLIDLAQRLLLQILLCEPFKSLAIFPKTHPRITVSLCCQDSLTMLFTIHPLSCVNLSICPLEGTLSLLDIVNEFSLVLSTIRPGHLSRSMHFVLLPLANVLASISPCVSSLSMNLTCEPFSIIC